MPVLLLPLPLACSLPDCLTRLHHTIPVLILSASEEYGLAVITERLSLARGLLAVQRHSTTAFHCKSSCCEHVLPFTMGEDMNTTTTAETATTAATAPLDPDPDTIKMFVGQIPRHWNEPDCRKLFEKYGPVFSLNILRDRQTQVSRGCCFVTFYHRKDAIAAQSALHNIEIIDGMHHPVQMKPADTENRNERKLFIGQLSKKHNEDDIRNYFAKFGHIEECTVLREADGKSRGCAFVTYTLRTSALAAIKDMHHSTTMEGCSAPLVVKFADTQREKEVKKMPAAGTGAITPAAATGLASLGNQAALLQQLSGGGINLQALTALAALFNPGMQVPQQNLLGVLGGVLSALGKLTEGGSGAVNTSAAGAVSGNPSALMQNGQSAAGKAQLAALLHQAPIQAQNLDSIAQLQQAQLQQAQFAQAQAAQQQQLLAMQVQAQQAQPAGDLSAYGYATGAVSTPAVSAPFAAQLAPIYQSTPTNGVQVVAAKAASPVGTALSTAGTAGFTAQLAGPGAAGIDPYQQAMQQYTLNALANQINQSAQVSVPSAGNGDVKGPEGSNLFIYHLPQDFGDSDLQTTFSPFGTVLSAKVFIDKVTNLSKCFGFVSYDNAVSAQNAIAAMNGFQIGSKRLKVQLKNERSHPYPKATA
ncbi:hypothetical protein Y032_0078g1213 [Ancylostoma ceylanicum]|uniref:RRM domain-containing protein n=1 Tax=Ancylostoma ceylanicum TaxID=53326 RepID=A0A016TU50_9BILA|nr:hypothetical protein Y032_0078g1213 [Ancylostoma ceylanicum]